MLLRRRSFAFFVLPAVLLSTLFTTTHAAPPRAIPRELIIRYKNDVGPSERASLRAQMNADLVHDFKFIKAEHLRLKPGQDAARVIAQFARNPRVEYVEPNYEWTIDAVPNDPRFPELYGMRNTGQTGGTAGADIKAVNAWDVFTGDPNLKIGVIDTGVDYNHPDLASNVWTNPGEIPGNNIDDDANGYVDDVHGYDFVNNDGDPFDDNGHGTHCSGTIAGIGNNGVGVTGVNWQAKIVGIKFLSAAGSGSTDNAIRGIQYAIAVGCRLTSNSWGGGGFSQALLDAISAAGAANQLFVAAAGNSSQNTDVTPSYPASYNSPYIIAVAATDHNDNLASFSNFGATTVDLAAPGVNILSCQPGGGYQLLSGTSMATPHAAGVVGLAMGRFPSATNLFIKSLILSRVDVKPQLNGKVLTNGRLNALLAISDPDETPPGQVTNLAVSEAGSSHLRLTWTATGDDGNTGRAAQYEIRRSTSPITDEASFLAGTPVSAPDPQVAGSAENLEVGGLAFTTGYYVALRARDEFGNAGPISNVATGTTLGAPDLLASPTSFSATLLSGASTSQTLTLSNTGPGTLDFSLPTPELAFAQVAPFPYLPIEKGAADPRVGNPVLQGNGGPDGFGYRWVDSNSPSGPAFSWVDVTGIGTQVTLSGDDATSSAIPIGFDFPFYGANFTSVRICTNGWLSLTSSSTAYDNQPLPNAGAPGNLIAPFWDDLDFGATNRVYTYNDGSRFIVSWVNVPHYVQSGPPTGPYTFQAILYPTGEIVYQYQSVNDPTNSATVGIQDAAGTVGLTTAFNTNYVANDLAVRFVPLRQWLTVSPASGRIAAGASQDVAVNFNALGLDGGLFDGVIHVLSNDPDESPTDLTAQLHVQGAPDIALAPAAVDFGTFFVGANPTRNLTVSNPGTDQLVVTSVTASDPDVHPDITSFTLPPHGARNVVLSFTPATARTLSGTLTVASNDPDNPNATASLAGQSIPAPSFAVTPESFDVSLNTNEVTSRTLRVSNNGGSNYVFTANAEVLAQGGSVTVHGEGENVDLPKDAPDVQSGPAPLKSGGPDVFGYTYQDSDEPGGPVFGWVDISGVGTAIPLNADDQNLGPFPLGFSFPHYGAPATQFRVCSNGWITLNATNTQTTFTNTALPNTGSTVPPSLFAAFWDDLDYRPVQAPNARAYYFYDGSRTIVQFKSVPRRGETALNDFEVIFYPNGQVVYQYLTMNAVTKNSATIGMQNAAKNDGLQVVFNQNYVKNNLAIRFRPPARFLTVSPSGGTVSPGGFIDLTVGFNADGLFGGNYSGQVRLAGNDPVQPTRNVPAALHVTGVPDVAANPAAIGFGNVFVGFPQLRELRVLNTGTDALVVSDVASSNPDFGVDQTAFTVPPLGQALVTVSYNPTSASPDAGTLTVMSNDADTPALAVSVSGTGLIAPDIDPQPAAITQTLPIPGTANQTLTLRNDGGSDLTFSIGTLLTPAAVPPFEALELGKEELDPRPGVLGSGGPDNFGYTWRDSDEPGGPTFDWVDITGVGTPVSFATGDDSNRQNIPIGFAFPFYGGSFDHVNVCTNGWISFTSTSTDLSNDPLPNTGAPENLIAAFWDDLNPGTAATRVWTHNDGNRFIVSYVGVPRLSSGGPYTFQILLYPSGRIVTQYLDMQGTRLNEATIGIQNAPRNDGLTVVHNSNYMHGNLAIEFGTVPEYMTVSPTSGTVPAGGSVDLAVAFDSQGLFGGVYNGAVRITSNDPDEGVKLVATTLTAVGVADIASVPASVDFGSVYVGLTAERTLELRNAGSDPLTISGLSFDNPDFAFVSAPALPVTLGQAGKLSLTVRWTPGAACAPCTGHLLAASNDPDENPFSVTLSGTGQIPPEIAVSPSSLPAALATTLGPSALTTTKKLVIENSGGSDLNWTAEALTALPMAITAESGETGKDQAGSPGAPVVAAHGGPDAFGYRWQDSDDPTGPAFDWVDIAGVGTPIPFDGDDQNRGPFPLPFPFTYYGVTYTSFRACTNGWITLNATNTQTTFTNVALPNAATATPPALIAPLWDDLTFSSAGDAYHHYDGEKFIISYVAVPRLGSGGPYTFQVLLYPSGTIDFQYLDMQGTRLNEVTVGIQNSAKDVGLTVVFNASYVKNNLRVRFSSQPSWLSLSPASGVTAAGERDTIDVHFDATGLADGDYDGVLRILSNDLDEPQTAVPGDLHVGVMTTAFHFDPNTLNLGSNGRVVKGTILPPSPITPQQVVNSSVLLERTVPILPGSPVSYGPDSVTYGFDRLAVQNVLAAGASVPVEVIGRFGDISWFRGVDNVKVKRPGVRAAGLDVANAMVPSQLEGSTYLPLLLSDPEGFEAERFDLWYSADGGEVWTTSAQNLAAGDYSWLVPPGVTTEGTLMVVAYDDEGVMGWNLTNVFEVMNRVTGIDDRAVPERFSLRLASRNPGTEARLELAVPRKGRIVAGVYDVRGALVRTLVDGELDAGYHPLFWDGRSNAGRSRDSGVYFIRVVAGDQKSSTRFVRLN